MSLDADLTFIETQFPVSKLSKESYKERMGNSSQTLTGLGKWWGRKPLILVRAAILGLLLPATNDPRRDREVFLTLLTMDPDGLWQRKSKPIALAELHARLTPVEQRDWFDPQAPKPRYRAGIAPADKARLQRLVFERLSYDDKLTYCDRPEHVAGPVGSAWAGINAHLGTDAASLPDLVRQLGQRRFGHTPRVGDAFCGGGSVPFEAARIGCDAYGSDLNPVAALLTWGALNIVGGGEAVAAQVRTAQQAVFATVDRQVTDWRIEHNDQGWRADAYCRNASIASAGAFRTWFNCCGPSNRHALARRSPARCPLGYRWRVPSPALPISSMPATARTSPRCARATGWPRGISPADGLSPATRPTN